MNKALMNAEKTVKLAKAVMTIGKTAGVIDRIKGISVAVSLAVSAFIILRK